MPFLDRIQTSFGRHDVSHVRAHLRGEAAEGAAAIDAAAFTIGHHIVFARSPSVVLAAHEAAHVVQQRSGRVLAAGDEHERHADAVARRVTAGQSSESLLDAYAARNDSPSQAFPIQRQHEPSDEKKPRSDYSLGDITNRRSISMKSS